MKKGLDQLAKKLVAYKGLGELVKMLSKILGPLVTILINIIPDIIRMIFGKSKEQKIEEIKMKFTSEIVSKIIEALRQPIKDMIKEQRSEVYNNVSALIDSETQKYNENINAIKNQQQEEEKVVAQKVAALNAVVEKLNALKFNMGFDGIKNKSASMGKKPMSAFLKVNKYENPQTVLDLISHICTSGMDLSVKDEFTPYSDKYNQLKEDYSKINTREAENPFVDNSISDLVKNCELPYSIMPFFLDHSGFNDAINVAVGGGYSSGKSSFLNNITGIGAVLPTGIEPVSMINTYISFSDKITKLIVSGKNCKGHVVKLNREVLDCIQHSSKSKIYVSSVLDELYLNVPVSKEREYLNGLVFIDTPGYNNSDNANKENGKKDIDTAIDALQDSDALFWCIDAEAVI